MLTKSYSFKVVVLHFIEVLKMQNLNQLFEEMLLATKNLKVYAIYTATIKQLEIVTKVTSLLLLCGNNNDSR
jgi:hypothetical protein